MNQTMGRRAHPRFPVELYARAKTLKPKQEGVERRCRTINLGDGGLRLRFATTAEVEKADMISVLLEAGGEIGNIDLQGRVRWVRPTTTNGGQDVGVQLSGSELAKWVLFLEKNDFCEATGTC